jgi:dTDP-4-amino-4,6-dideoxy-D-galactose acyltransferase
MIEYLPWDSDFFNFKVGKTTITNSDFDFVAFENSLNNFKLVYLFSDSPIENSNNLFEEQKLTFSKPVEPSVSQSTKGIFNLRLISTNSKKLEDLVYLSGENSRFNLDPNFSNNEFKSMYLYWFKQAFDYSLGKQVVLKVLDGEPVGFVLYSIKGHFLNIELISVLPTFQGKGIASELLKELESVAFNNACLFLQVVTQGVNLKAVALYEKYGFHLKEKKFVYHFWNI